MKKHHPFAPQSLGRFPLLDVYFDSTKSFFLQFILPQSATLKTPDSDTLIATVITHHPNT